MTIRVAGGPASVAGVRAFLEPRHVEQATHVADYAGAKLTERPEPFGDEAARVEARWLAADMGTAGLYAPIADQDLRGLCVARDLVAGSSPLADAVFALQALCATSLIIGDNHLQRSRWLPDLIAGRAIGGFAMTEPEAGSDAAAMCTTARRDGNDWVLDGEKHLISNAGIADLYIVFAVTTPGAGSRGITAFAVPAATSGFAFVGAQEMAAAHPLGRLAFHDCRVSADAVLGQLDRGFKLAMMTLDRLRPSVGAAACGMAARSLDEARAHAVSRRQFGQRLADFQLVRAKLGRMATDLDAARLLVYRAAWEKDTGTDRITVQAAMAKSFATEAAQRIVDDAVQVVGGRGVVIGHPVERLYRSVRALRIYEGATDVLRLIIGGAVIDRSSGVRL